MKRSPMRRSSKPMKRTKMARGPELKRTRMKPRSEKREAIYAGTHESCPPCPRCHVRGERGEGEVTAAPGDVIPGCSRGADRIAYGGEVMACPACGGTGREGRRAFNVRILAERGTCEVCPRIIAGRHTLAEDAHRIACYGWRCEGAPVDVHEILARSAGGDILDPANVLATCRAGHDWIGRYPDAAHALGLRDSRYAGRNEAR